MGFFSDLQSDLSAVGGAEEQKTLQADSVDLDSMLESIDEDALISGDSAKKTVVEATVNADAAPETEMNEEAAPTEAPASDNEDFLSKLSEALNTNDEEAAKAVPDQSAVLKEPSVGAMEGQYTNEAVYTAQNGGFNMEEQMSRQATDENAVVTAGMNVNGDISTTGNLEVMGNITGNVMANGKLTVAGSITGNSNAAEVYAENARINGEIRSQGSVKIGQSTVVIGNIIANGAVIAGAVKGDIDVQGPVILDTTAIVMGNIKSQSVQINNGAVIEGMCSQVYAEVNPGAFFDKLQS